METEEIRNAIMQARRARAAVDALRGELPSNEATLKTLGEVLGRLADATEELLAEREAFAGRLRRTPPGRLHDGAPAMPPSPHASDSPAGFTPSPATDA